MNNTQFKKRLEKIIPLVLSYAADHYKLRPNRDPKKTLEKIGERQFINKCHEGFKLAQKEIVDSLIEIEKETKKFKDRLKKIKGNKHLSELKQQKNYQQLVKKIHQLIFQKAVFEELTNVIAWTTFKLDRTRVKALMQPDMHHKSLLEGNIDSLIEVARHYNKDVNKFALITDITSCIGMGDLVIIDTKKDKWYLAEFKEGRVNDIILKTLKRGNLGIAQKHLLSLQDKKSALKFLKQFRRVLNQHDKSSGALRYIKTGVGKDLFTGRNKLSVETDLVDEKFTPLLFGALKELYSQSKEDELYFPFDSGLVALIRNPKIARKWDFQHFILHSTLEPKSDCPYTKHKPSIASFKDPEVADHFKKIQRISLYELKNKVFSFTHEPLFFNVPQKRAVDLLTGKLAIYIYFDSKEFFRLCKKANLKPSWDNYEKSIQGEPRHVRRAIVNFNGKCLAYGTKDKRFQFTYGFLFRIVHEMQTATSVIEQLKAMVKFV